MMVVVVVVVLLLLLLLLLFRIAVRLSVVVVVRQRSDRSKVGGRWWPFHFWSRELKVHVTRAATPAYCQ